VASIRPAVAGGGVVGGRRVRYDIWTLAVNESPAAGARAGPGVRVGGLRASGRPDVIARAAARRRTPAALAKVSVATRSAVRESVGSGFDSAPAALLPWTTPRTPVDRHRAGRASLPSGSRVTPWARGVGCGWCGKPPGLTPRNQPRNVTRVAPRQVERLRSVRACSLRTQQRAESQCQQTPSAGEWAGRPTVPRSRGGFLWYTTSTQLVETSDHSVGTPVRRGRPAAIQSIHGEFDPGSGRTLAACLTHASRARPLLREGVLAANG
jgi:hypothetical protein